MNNLVKRKVRKKEYYGLVWIGLAILFMLIFSVYPAISALLHSFTEWNLKESTFIGFNNFTRLFTDTILWKSTGNLVVLITTGMLLGNLAAIILAELIHNLKKKRVASFYRFVFILPALVPGIVIMLLWTKIVFNPSESGLMNTILSFFSIDALGWYYDEKISLLSMILTGFPWMGGTSFLIYLAGLNNISEEVYEAAALDGASIFKRILYIDLPLIKSQIKYFVVLGVIGGMQSFDMQLMFTSGGPNYSTTVPGYYMYETAFFGGDFGYASSIGLVLFVVTLIITIINNRSKTETE